MTISMTELQGALSPVPLASWAARWSRAAARAATISREEPVVLTEMNRLGVVVWQAPAPNRTGRDEVGDVHFVGQWIVEPKATVVGRSLQKLQLKALFAPDRSFGPCGLHSTGQALSIIGGALVGAAVGAYGLGGPLALVWGFAVGAILGCLAYIGTALSGRRGLRGPIGWEDTDLLETVMDLAAVGPNMDLPDGPSVSVVARGLAWRLTDPMNPDAEYRRLRYYSRMLAHAFSEVRRAQWTLDCVIFRDEGQSSTDYAQRVTSDAAEIIERLQVRAEALSQVAEQIHGAIVR